MAKRDKLSIRLPGDQGPNLYDSSTPIKDLPVRGLGWWPQIVNKGAVWWVGIIGTALLAAWHHYGFHRFW